MSPIVDSEYRMLGNGSRFKTGWRKELDVGASIILPQAPQITK
jgi:hypothetical protein